MSDALHHIETALAVLCLEAYRGRDPESMSPADHFTIAEDLKRIDCAIGPKGESMFARIADKVQEAYVELLAAKAALNAAPPAETPLRGNPASDPYLRIVMLFDRDATAGSFLREDGDGGFAGAVYRMAREIDRLRATTEDSPKNPQQSNHTEKYDGID